MILFHGSNTEIDIVDLDKCRPYKDFGKGFYLTTIPEQAEKMARRVARIYGGEPCVTTFEFDDTVLKSDILHPSLETPMATRIDMFSNSSPQ